MFVPNVGNERGCSVKQGRHRDHEGLAISVDGQENSQLSQVLFEVSVGLHW